MPSLRTIIDGRGNLPGPLAQLALGRDGTFYVVAAGRANHAGKGNWHGITTGNSSFIGIEAENTGLPNDAWPAVQLEAYRRGVAAILKKAGADARMCCGHREYALPPGRKTDPSFDMDDFRYRVAAIMNGTAPSPARIPRYDEDNRPTLIRGSASPLVAQIQEKLGLGVTGRFDAPLEAAIRQFQRTHQLVPDGIVGPRTWSTILT